MKKDNITLHILLGLSITLFIIGLFVLTAITVGKADLASLWPWLLCLPVGGAGILYMAREYKQK